MSEYNQTAALLVEVERLRDVSIALRYDLLLRAEIKGGHPVVNASNGIWQRFCAVLDALTVTLTPEQIADGWIAHDGGACPVEGKAKVSFILGSGAIQYGWDASKVIWPHNAFIHELGETIPFDACVIAYKIEERHD